MATVLIQKGTLHVGDVFLAGETFGRVRAMVNYKGETIDEAPPSTPVEVLGLNEVPDAGDVFQVVADEKEARQVAERRTDHRKNQLVQQAKKVSLDDLFKQIQEGNVKDLNIVVKADVQGSAEAVKQSLEKLSTAEVRVKVIHFGVGTVTESDIMLASASNAIIIGFNVRPDAKALKSAEVEDVDVRLYRIIYEAIDDVKKAMVGTLRARVQRGHLRPCRGQGHLQGPEGRSRGWFICNRRQDTEERPDQGGQGRCGRARRQDPLVEEVQGRRQGSSHRIRVWNWNRRLERRQGRRRHRGVRQGRDREDALMESVPDECPLPDEYKTGQVGKILLFHII